MMSLRQNTFSKVTYFQKRKSPKNKEQRSHALVEMSKGVRQSWVGPVVELCLPFGLSGKEPLRE